MFTEKKDIDALVVGELAQETSLTTGTETRIKTTVRLSLTFIMTLLFHAIQIISVRAPTER